ncbi:hypothetical protein ASU33_18430 [Solirubrum puertoriconensis]|uniref:Uncharacterized protein n=2 Tax=Solirubrum puertoriconensis TaxID=1751427 RepID=A0A9X0L6E9_SOLP1|nr:hypothetical protein ASU33_18430 [Solirubrum puertoriconensis]
MAPKPMQTRVTATFNENYLDVETVRRLFYECLDADARVSRGRNLGRNMVSFVVYGYRTEQSLFRFYRLLHRHDPFARLLVDGRVYSA